MSNDSPPEIIVEYRVEARASETDKWVYGDFNVHESLGDAIEQWNNMRKSLRSAHFRIVRVEMKVEVEKFWNWPIPDNRKKKQNRRKKL